MVNIATAVIFLARLFFRAGSWLYRQVGYEACVTVERVMAPQPVQDCRPEVIIKPCCSTECTTCQETTRVVSDCQMGRSECATCG